MYGVVVEPVASECIDIGCAHVLRPLGQFYRVIAKGAVGWRQISGAVVVLDGFDELVVVDLSPEVFAVGDRSVMALVGG